MERDYKDFFTPLLLTVCFLVWVFVTFFFFLLIKICLVKHQKEWQTVMSYFMLSCKEWRKEVKEGRKCMPFLLRRIERERRHSNLSPNQTKRFLFFSSFLYEWAVSVECDEIFNWTHNSFSTVSVHDLNFGHMNRWIDIVVDLITIIITWTFKHKTYEYLHIRWSPLASRLGRASH